MLRRRTQRGQHRKTYRVLTLFFAVLFSLTSILPGGVLSASAASEAPEGWTGNYTLDGNAVIVNNPGFTNNFVVSSASSTAFSYEAVMSYQEESVQGAGLLFGVGDKTNPSQYWGGVHINDQEVRLFFEQDAQNLDITKAVPGGVNPSSVHIKLTVDRYKNFCVYVNDMVTPVISTQYANFKGGNVGLMAFNTAAKFTDILFEDLSTSTGNGLSNFKGGIFTEGDGTITLGNPGLADNVVVSDTYAKAFVFEADMTVSESTTNAEAGLLFGVKNRDNPGNQWCCMKIREEGLWAFNLADYTDPEGLLIDLPIPDPNYTLKGTNHLKLVADVNGNLEFYVNDMENPVTTKSYPRYVGGYVGFTSFATEATFSNIQFTDTTPKTFNTNLSGWENANSTWQEVDTGYQGASLNGDGFSTAAQSVDGDFTLEADVTIESGTALGLVFRAQGANVATDGSYVVNCDLVSQCFKFFRFPGYEMSTISIKTFEEVGLYPEQGKTYHMRLDVQDNKATMYFDDHLIFDDIPDVNTDNYYTSGRVGVMAFNAVANFQNVYLRIGSSANEMTNFTLEPHSATLVEGDQLYYIVPAGTDVTQLAPTFTIPDTATVDKSSGSVQDFSSPVVYTVKAANGDERPYTVTVYKEEEITDADRNAASGISDRIADLPESLTVEDKATVDQLKEDYDNLTPLQKMLVEGVDRLNEAVERIEELTRPLRITCVGDSITQGVGSSNENLYSYPAQLQKILGDGYQVKNAGVSGSNVTKGKGYPYWTTTRYQEGKDFAPDIAIIMIGTNDALNDYVWNPSNPAESTALFKQDYTTLIEEYKALESNPKIFMVLPMRSYQTEGRQENLENYIIPALKEIAKEQDLQVIDMNAFTTGHPDWFPDGLHPNDGAYAIIAEEFAKYIRGYASADLASISLDGNPIADFDPDTLTYEVQVPAEDEIPELTAQASHQDASVTIGDPVDTLPGSVDITVTSGDGRTIKTYTVTFVEAAQTLDEAKSAVEAALAQMTVSNNTTAEDMMAVVAAAIENEAITAQWTEEFTMQQATEEAAGQIDGVITLYLGNDSVNITIDKEIAKLPVQPQTLAEAKAAAEEALAQIVPSNDTTAEQIMAVVEGVITNDEISAAWSEEFVKVNATVGNPGSITGVITLSLDGETPVDIVIEWEIPALEDEPQPSLPDHPSIPGGSDSDWEWPTGSDTESGTDAVPEKTNPQSGDSTQLMAALILMAVSAGAALHIGGKKKR